MKTIHDIITDIERRAESVGVSIAQLCKKAGISNSTFTRWKSETTQPNFDSYLKLTSALETIESNHNTIHRLSSETS